MRITICPAFAVVFFLFGSALVAGQNSKFDYLKVKGNSVKTTHYARYKIKIDKSFKPIGEFHHQPTYANKQFNVSLAAFSEGESLIMVHAETHTDDSGGLDYSNLTPDSLNELKFTTREQCAPAEAETELSINPEIKFLREKGFSVKLPFYLKQYFTTSTDGKAEVVISYGKHVDSCSEDVVTSDFKKQIEQQIKQKVKVEKD